MNQLLLGASIPYALGLIVYFARRRRASLAGLVLWPLLMALSMLWAVAPDIPRLLGMQDLYMRYVHDPRCDIFYWHYTIDMAETDSSWYVIPFTLLFASLLFIAWNELRHREED